MAKKTATNWKNIWAGSWGVLDVSDWVEFYTSTLKISRRSFLNTVAFVVRNGKSSCWVDADYLSGTHAALSKEYPTLTSAKTLAATLKKKVDAVMAAMQAPILDPAKSYEAYRKAIRDYYIPHVHVKYLVEGLDEKKLKVFLPVLQAARLYAEPVFEETLYFGQGLGSVLKPTTRLSPRLLQFLTRDELKGFFKNGKLPKLALLKQRQKYCVGVLVKGKPVQLLYGDKARAMEKKLTVLPKELRGQTAYVGVVEGIVRIVVDPKNQVRLMLEIFWLPV